MSYSARKPYTNIKQGIAAMFRARVRHMKELVLKESEFEKPYLDGEYPYMQFKFPVWQWGPWDVWRRPSMPFGPFGRLLPFEAMDKRTRLLFIFPLPRCWVTMQSNSGDCVEVGEYTTGFASIFTGAPHQGWNWNIWTSQPESFRVMEAGEGPTREGGNNPYNLGITGGHETVPLSNGLSTNITFHVLKINDGFEGDVDVLGEVSPRGHGPIKTLEATYAEAFMTPGDTLSKVYTQVKPVPGVFGSDPIRKTRVFNVLETYEDDKIPCESDEFEVDCGCDPSTPAISLEAACPAGAAPKRQYYIIDNGCPEFRIYHNKNNEVPYPPDPATEWISGQVVERRFREWCELSESQCATTNRYFGVLDGDGTFSNVITVGGTVTCNCPGTINYTTNQMQVNETQNLSITDEDGGCDYAWTVESAGACGSPATLSDDEGSTTTLTAPAANTGCICNATVHLWCCDSIIDSLTIAINAFAGVCTNPVPALLVCQSAQPACCCISYTCKGVLAHVGAGDGCVNNACGGYSLAHCAGGNCPAITVGQNLGSSGFYTPCASIPLAQGWHCGGEASHTGCCSWMCA